LPNGFSEGVRRVPADVVAVDDDDVSGGSVGGGVGGWPRQVAPADLAAAIIICGWDRMKWNRMGWQRWNNRMGRCDKIVRRWMDRVGNRINAHNA